MHDNHTVIEKPKVSVIIPAYNAETTLKKSVQSVLEQTLTNVEIIIVNDGSTDNTEAVSLALQREYSNIVFVSKTNKGVSAARNAGIDMASGEFISFLDSDDAMDTTMLQKMVEIAEKESADVVQCGRKEIYPNGETRIVLPNLKIYGKTLIDSPKILCTSAFIWDKLYNASIVKDNNIHLDEKIKYAEETVFILKVLSRAKSISAIREPLYQYSARRVGAATFSFDKRLLDNAKGIAATCDVALNEGIYPKMEGALWNLAKGYYFRRVNDFELYDDKELQKEIVTTFFNLFDNYFYNWRNRVRGKLSVKNAFDYIEKRIYINIEAMYAYIDSPNFYKKVRRNLSKYRRKICGTIKKVLFQNTSRKYNKLKKMFADHKNGMKYLKYYHKEVDSNIVLLSSNSGTLFSDNIYYIAESIIKHHKNMKVYVVSNNIERDFRYAINKKIHPEFVKSHTKKHIVLLATAKYLVSNTKLPTYFLKKPNQIYINTWHGTPLKTLGKSMAYGKKELGFSQKEFLTADYLLYPNKYMMEHMVEDFGLKELYKGDILLSGYPRNSEFFRTSDIENIRNAFNLKNKRVYVYMPTWRGGAIDSIDTINYQTELSHIIQEFEDKLNDNVVVFVKLHRYVKNSLNIKMFKKIRLFPDNYEVYHFLKVADCLITDYSSVLFDFANTRKEILLFVYDKDKYLETRGMYLDLQDLPFPCYTDIEPLVNHINNEIPFQFNEKNNKFLTQYCPYDSEKSSDNFVDFMLNKANNVDGDVINYTSIDKEWHAIFMPSINNETAKSIFDEVVKKRTENDMLIFFMSSFNAEMDSLLSKERSLNYIVVPGEMLISCKEALLLTMYRKYHIFSKYAKRIYERELNRIFPNIHFSKYTNYSNVQKFKDITNLFS